MNRKNYLRILILLQTLILAAMPVGAFAADNETAASYTDPAGIDRSGEDISAASSYDSESSYDDVPEFVPGIIESDMQLQYPDDADADTGEPKSGGTRGAANEFPQSYISEYITPVKNQGLNGLCWSFAALGVMESNLLKNGYGEYDLSEVHMGYALSNTGGNQYGIDRDPQSGGNSRMASAYLMRGMPEGKCIGGAVSEEDDPMTATDLSKGLEVRDAEITYTDKPKIIMPSNFYYIGETKSRAYDEAYNNRIKSAIMDYGSVGASLEWGEDEESEQWYNKKTASFYRGRKVSGTDHAIMIVGWDDNYPKTNFNEGHQPPRNGAWKIRNSWGPNWGSDGYAWVSYYDVWFPSSPYTIDGTASFDSSKMKISEYDYTPAEDSSSAGSIYARFFTADTDEIITDVMVFAASSSEKIEVDLITDTGDLKNYKFSPRGNVEAYYPGWYTIKLDNSLMVDAGTRYGVAVRTDAYVAYDEESEHDTAIYARSSRWGRWNWYDEKSRVVKSRGWCIKAVSDIDQDEIGILKAQAAFEEDQDLLWDLTKGENTDAGSVIYDLAEPGEGPNGTSVSYTDISNTDYLSETGEITRPGCGGTDQEVDFTVKVSRGEYEFTLPVHINVKVQPHVYGGWVVDPAPTEFEPGRRTITCTGCGLSRTETLAKKAPSLRSVTIKKLKKIKVKKSTKKSKKNGKKSKSKKAVARNVTISWNKISENDRSSIKQIQIQYSTDKTFTRNVKDVYVSSGKTSKKIKNLKKGRRYYFRIRAYTNAGSEVHISAWSGYRSVKIKKK